MVKRITVMFPAYITVLSIFLIAAQGGSRAITVLSQSMPIQNRSCVVIDAGHGGEDGGAVSCTGIHESKLNLEIALCLEDMFHLFGIDTYMIRTTDRSVYTQGNTIAARKASDLKERVRIINEIQPNLLLSIHQNYFPDRRYSGPQVFYRHEENSKAFASTMQKMLNEVLASQSNRKEKQSEGIYLMEHVQCTGVLIECGFLSNPEEEALLRNKEYQKKLCAAAAVAAAHYLSVK